MRPTDPAILHLGLGSFHRAHQAVYMQRLAQAGLPRWRLASGNIREEGGELIDALRAQGGGYTLETVAPDTSRRYEWITSIDEIVSLAGRHGRIAEIGGDAATRIVSFTVTEAGYFLRPDDSLDVEHADVAADLAAARAGLGRFATIYGALVALLRARVRSGAGPVTLLCCDNLRHNGERSRRGLLQFVTALGDEPLLAWIGGNTTSPNTMVDRITPRPSGEVVDRVRAATGREDPAALMAESYLQWVVEDRFAAGRPAWEQVGAELVDDVRPYEEAKIRLLNATHSCLAWAGTLRGCRFIHEDVADAQVRQLAVDYATLDAIPVLMPSPVDLPAYRDRVLERFANPEVRDTNERVAADSYAKIPAFIAPTVLDRLARRESIDAVAMLPALYLRFLQRWHAGALPFAYQDQALRAEEARAICEAGDPVGELAGRSALWGAAAGDPRLVAAMRAASGRLAAMGF